jgi:hypothetical protein
MSELPSKMNCPGGISSILVPIPKEGIELEYLVIPDGPTIEKLILQRNIRHFRQAEFTPLATNEVIEEIGFGADTNRAEQLLEGDDLTDITDDEWSRYLLTGFQLLPQYWGRILGSFFYGGISSSKNGHIAPS